jgi:LysR family transcriptional regulator, transcriptional activator of nhaA
MNWLNYHHLHYFWVVAKEESITKAGKQLRLAPSTVSMQLSKLEEELGGSLFRRTGRNLELTELGQVVFRYADEIFSLGLEMLDTIKGRLQAGPPRFTVGIVDILPKLVTRKILQPALSLPQGVRLVCHEGKEKQLLAELAVHDLDLVLTDTPAKSGLSIKVYSHLLGECGISFCAVAAMVDRLLPDFPRSLHGAPMLLPTSLSALRGSLDQWFAAQGIRPRIIGEFDDRALIKVFGQAGDGVFVVPTIIEEEVCRQHQVAIVGRSQTVRERFYAISVERIIKHPAVIAIRDAIRGFDERWLLAP